MTKKGRVWEWERTENSISFHSHIKFSVPSLSFFTAAKIMAVLEAMEVALSVDVAMKMGLEETVAISGGGFGRGKLGGYVYVYYVFHALTKMICK